MTQVRRRQQFFKSMGLALSFSVAALLTSACDDESDGMTESGGHEGGEGAQACMPSGTQPGHEALLNAALDPGVEVIVKQPRHPGAVGPANLP